MHRVLFVSVVLLFGCVCAAPLAAQGTFSRTGDTTVGRNLCKAILLNDGRVLVTGGTRTGDSGSVFNREAEVYDPLTSMFSAVGSMSVPRIGHAAVRLVDGTVLVLGGQPDPNSSTASAELFDPATRAFTAIGNMIAPREDSTATLLKDGRVLIVGGTFRNSQSQSFIVISSEIFNPTTSTFTLGADLSRARVLHSAVALPDGRVLILGGYGVTDDGMNAVLLKEVEMLDPASGAFSTVGRLNEGHVSPSATLLPDGRVVVAGGLILTADAQAFTPSNTVELFDPAVGTSSTQTTMSEGRANHASAALTDGRVLLAGGTTGANSIHSTASADLFDPVTGKISPAAPLTEQRTQAPAVRLLDGRVLIIGGARLDQGGVAARLKTAEIYSP
jgi:hypothetical protein